MNETGPILVVGPVFLISMERRMTNIQDITIASIKLNKTSKNLKEKISELESILKKLNFGIEVWTPQDKTGLELGYIKISSGNWGLAIRKDDKVMSFSNSPRLLRVLGIDHIPVLLSILYDTSMELEDNINSKLITVEKVINMLTD